MLNILGKAHCSWSETDETRDIHKTTHYQGNCTYIQTSNNLMAEQHMEGYHDHVTNFSVIYFFDYRLISVGSSHLVAGNHKFDFAFVLPKNLPSSLEGIYGYIRYTAQVVLKRKYKSDLCYYTTFAVLSYVDLNLKRELKVKFIFTRNFSLE